MGTQKKDFVHDTHRWLEGKALLLTVLATLLVLVGGIVEIVPLIAVKSNVPTIAEVTPYSPLELEGRDIYVREGCYNCHSQQIRPFRAEVLRYGDYSRAGEFIYDRPFQWGSKRTGPDLARVGGKYPDAWHYRHMEDPQQTSKGSIMPRYPWLLKRKLNLQYTGEKMTVLTNLGHPYSSVDIGAAEIEAKKQAAQIVKNLAEGGIEAEPDREIIALIAYLQRLGADWKKHKANQKAQAVLSGAAAGGVQ